MSNTIAHSPPVRRVQFYGIGPYFMEPFHIKPVGFPCSFRTFPVLQILKVDANAKAGNNQYQHYYKMFLCFYQNGAFEFLSNAIGFIEF